MNDFVAVLNNPPMLHAVTVHLPIGLAIIGVPLVIVSVIFDRVHALRWTALMCYLALSIAAWAAVSTGQTARAEVPATAPAEIWETLERHEQLASYLWIAGIAAAVFIGLTALPASRRQFVARLFAVVSSVGAAAWIALVGHYGGTLVYEHGVGTPAMAQYHRAAEAISSGKDASSSDAGEALADGSPTAENGQGDPAPSKEETGGDDYTPGIGPIDTEAASNVSYAQDVAPLLEQYCISCHRDGKEQGGLNLTTVDGMLEGGEDWGPAIVPGNPDESPMVQFIRGILQPQMPKGDFPLTEDELHTIRQWIHAGAPAD